MHKCKLVEFPPSTSQVQNNSMSGCPAECAQFQLGDCKAFPGALKGHKGGGKGKIAMKRVYR